MDNRTIEQVRDNETIWINKAIKLEEENKQLKEDKKKAIEYIKENYPTSTINDQDDKHKLLEILGDKE